MGDIDASSLHAFESAAFRAWPALEEQVVHGWRLRFAGGYTRRANSVNAQADAGLLDAAHLADIERRYRERGLPPVFRLVGFSPVARAVDAALEARGYRRVDPCLVMAAPLAGGSHGRGELVSPATRDLESWLASFRDITGQAGADLSLHGRLLGAIDAPVALAVDAPDGAPPADCCAVGVVAEGTLGLFDVATRPAARGPPRACAAS